MKNSKFLTFVLTIFVSVVITSCVEDDDFNIPTVALVEPDVTVTNTISQIKSFDNGGLVNFSQIDGQTDNTSVVISGYVVSNDEAGNFYKTIIIQDAPENPTAAIQLDVDATSLYSQYKPGQKVYVVLHDANNNELEPLGMKKNNGVLHIGKISGNDIERISGSKYKEYILRSSEITPIVPKVITPSDYENGQFINMLVKIEDMQISLAEVGLTYANLNNTFSVNRTLINCTDNSEIIFRNSGFSDFKTVLMPEGRGSITAVLSRYNSTVQLFIRDTDDLQFTETNRCDPAQFIISNTNVDCDDTIPTVNNDILLQDFESVTNQSDLAAAGWTLVNSNGGTYNWGVSSFSGNSYGIANAYNTGENVNAWLISPEINLDATSDEVLNFDVQSNFDGGEVMAVYVSTDFVDADTDSNWSLLQDVNIPTGPSNGFGSFEAAGPINLSCLSGTIRIAFRYFGSDPGITTRYHVDNIAIRGN